MIIPPITIPHIDSQSFQVPRTISAKSSTKHSARFQIRQYAILAKSPVSSKRIRKRVILIEGIIALREIRVLPCTRIKCITSIIPKWIIANGFLVRVCERVVCRTQREKYTFEFGSFNLSKTLSKNDAELQLQNCIMICIQLKCSYNMVR
jgi:hypothetical protein